MTKKRESRKKPATNAPKPAEGAPGKLPPKRQTFVDEYLIDLNGAQAAIRAGFSAKTAKEQGSRLLANVHVKAAIDKAMAERSERTKIKQDYVLETIRETVERCKGLTAVRTKDGALVKTETEDGDQAVMCEFDPQAVLKGCELLGRHLRMFVDKVEVTDKRDLSGKSTEELNFFVTHNRWPEPGELPTQPKKGSSTIQ